MSFYFSRAEFRLYLLPSCRKYDYRACTAYYPFVLGAQPARLIDMAAFYAAIATEGRRPSPYGIESIEQNGRSVYTHTPEPKWPASGDRPAVGGGARNRPGNRASIGLCGR